MGTHIEEYLSDAECPPEAEAEAVGARLRKLREAHGKSQREFAALIDVTEGNWSDFENGKKRLSLNAALRLATGPLNISLDWIYLGRSARRRAATAEAVKAEQPKRKLGRPPGSKNKPKSKPPINGDPYRFL